jgi:hypothetical protein
MSGGSSRGKGLAGGRGKGETKGSPIVWDGSLGPDDFDELVYQFSVESKSDFTCHIYDFVIWFNYLRHVRFSRRTYVCLVYVLTCYFMCSLFAFQ